MTLFLDVRASAVGDNLATSVAINQGTDITNYQTLPRVQLLDAIRGRHVLIGIHGFNVNREDGIAHLSNWEGLLQLDPVSSVLASASVFIGVLWPGDSVWLHALAYPEEPRVADEAAALIAPFVDANFAGAASISLVSHSLGARVLLGTVSKMNRPVRRAIMMAGAIDDNCLNAEFQAAAGKIEEISVLASHDDMVLSAAFPLGNFLGGILDVGHPWLHAALGRGGPTQPWPTNFQAPYEIPDIWSFGHGDYLKVDRPPTPTPGMPIPVDVPPQGTAAPIGPGWQEAFTAAFVSTRFR